MCLQSLIASPWHAVIEKLRRGERRKQRRVRETGLKDRSECIIRLRETARIEKSNVAHDALRFPLSRSVCLSVCLSIRLSIRVSICPFVYRTLDFRLLAALSTHAFFDID